MQWCFSPLTVNKVTSARAEDSDRMIKAWWIEDAEEIGPPINPRNPAPAVGWVWVWDGWS